MFRIAIVIIFSMLSVQISTAGIFGPKDYDECILQSMKGVTSDVAARLIWKSCREKFPLNQNSKKGKKLSSEIVGKITGRAGFNGYGSFTGNLYNGDSDYTITQVKIFLYPKERDILSGLTQPVDANDSDTLTEYADKMKSYNVDIVLAPLTSAYFSVRAIDEWDGNVSWSIDSAKGYKQKIIGDIYDK